MKSLYADNTTTATRIAGLSDGLAVNNEYTSFADGGGEGGAYAKLGKSKKKN
jgi:hypothetical protein